MAAWRWQDTYAACWLESTAVRRLGQISTTYLTSTLTGILTALAIRRWPPGWRRSTGILIAAVIGATLGAVAVSYSPHWAPTAVLIPIAIVLGGSLTLARHSGPAGPPRARRPRSGSPIASLPSVTACWPRKSL